ncbi:hypothetical protein SELMODRAFT_421852 [Selaginella moellendorffii]|uniref:C2H2-type domain-containing protein n=1 Tax=Selaginella moellendorffii TaxID=88036 RepID=D8SGK0_SELML|nr:hypothetical protein SELMODRAFT_421852 [Selaginella moellendorffii]
MTTINNEGLGSLRDEKRKRVSGRPEVAPSIDALNAGDDQQSKQMVVYADTSGFLRRQEEEAKDGQEEVFMLELNPVSDPVEEDDDDNNDEEEEEKDDDDEELLPGSSDRHCKARKRTRTYKTGIYPCSICERVFKYSWHLKNHQLVHSDELQEEKEIHSMDKEELVPFGSPSLCFYSEEVAIDCEDQDEKTLLEVDSFVSSSLVLGEADQAEDSHIQPSPTCQLADSPIGSARSGGISSDSGRNSKI